MKLKLPSVATAVLGFVLGLIVVLNTQVFHFGPPWVTGINIAVVWAGVFGVALGVKAVIKVTQAEAAVIAVVLGGVQLLLIQSGLDSTVKTVLQVVVVVAGALGFGPDTQPKVALERTPIPEPPLARTSPL